MKRTLLFTVSGFFALGILQSVIANPLIELGKKITLEGNDNGAPACMACHGEDGHGSAEAGFPFLSGQSSAYIRSQLQHISTGTRMSPVMEPTAQALSPDEMDAVAAYYSSLPPMIDPAKLAALRYEVADFNNRGQWLAARGDWPNNIPACNQCHGPAGMGVGESFPMIAGLPESYIVDQLNYWKNDQRDPGPQGLMHSIAKRLADEDIQLVAHYYANLAASSTEKQAEGAVK